MIGSGCTAAANKLVQIMGLHLPCEGETVDTRPLVIGITPSPPFHFVLIFVLHIVMISFIYMFFSMDPCLIFDN